MKRKLPIICLIMLAVYGYDKVIDKNEPFTQPVVSASSLQHSANDEKLARAYKNRQRNLQIGGSGKVINILPDDLKGSRHQKFILQLATGQTLLIAHNIDLAPRISTLSVGDQVAFYGEYEWNDKGGVIHWTHHDPSGRHVDGWLRHRGNTYQ